MCFTIIPVVCHVLHSTDYVLGTNTKLSMIRFKRYAIMFDFFPGKPAAPMRPAGRDKAAERRARKAAVSM